MLRIAIYFKCLCVGSTRKPYITGQIQKREIETKSRVGEINKQNSEIKSDSRKMQRIVSCKQEKQEELMIEMASEKFRLGEQNLTTIYYKSAAHAHHDDITPFTGGHAKKQEDLMGDYEIIFSFLR